MESPRRPRPDVAQAMRSRCGAGAARQDGMPFVGPAKGALLAGLVAERAPALAVEVGALAGYSALTIACALPPGGRLVSIEADWKWALVAKRFVWQAGQGERRSKPVRPYPTLPYFPGGAPLPWRSRPWAAAAGPSQGE